MPLPEPSGGGVLNGIGWLARLRRWWARRRRSRATAVVAVAVVVLAGLVTWSTTRGEPGVSFGTEEAMLPVGAPGESVELDTTLYLPDGADAAEPAPAVLVAHGFGGSKDSVEADATALARAGFVVLTWSARGFGASGGRIGLNDPDYEVADASALIDLLAQRPEVLLDGAGDPRVGVTGASYGGALALLAAGYDDRIDAIVPAITWNSLRHAFLPNYAGAAPAGTPAAAPDDPADEGVFKKLWAGLFFGAGTGLDAGLLGGAGGSPADGDSGDGASGDSGAGDSGADSGEGEPVGTGADGTGADGVDAGGLPSDVDPLCGRFRLEVCAAYTEAATTGAVSDTSAALLERLSPASVLDRITAPTLLIQGQADSLFPLSEADANARGIAATGTDVAVAWYSGGHDGSGSDADAERVRELTTGWFDHYLRGGPELTEGFEYAQVTGLSTNSGRPTSQRTIADAYPGLAADTTTSRTVDLAGPAQPIAYPPGGNPGAISLLPGLSQLTGLVDGFGLDLPGQAAAFESAALTEPVQLVGSPTVEVRVASPTGSAVLFGKLYDVDADGSTVLPQGLVAPIRLTGLTDDLATATPVRITLSALAYRFETQHRIRLVLSTTDQGYLTPAEPSVFQVALTSGELTVPDVPGRPLDAASTPWAAFFGGLVVLAAVLAGLGWWWGRRRRVTDIGEPDLADVPLVVSGLSKAYADGHVAVRELSFRVEAEQVVGLLGPNGAGKTTTLRMLMGLIVPTAGQLLVYGHRVTPGAPVLSRLGAFVEGTGFLPHLSGADNLALYWRATGRPAGDARIGEALEIAGLGTAVERKVRTYSQGMRQRLAIAQAMLGLPDLLVLDEPTNGLDPPQIREMRAVLRRYAAPGSGRTVLVSSHLLAEVEQTCTHVVVMHRGELVAQGTVGEVVGESASVLLGVDDDERAVRVARGLAGVAEVERTGDGVVVELAGLDRAGLVRELVGAGVGVERLTPRRRLEDVFISLVGQGHDVD